MKKKIFVDCHVFDHEYQGSRTFIKELYNKLTLKEDLDFYFAAHNIENLRNEIELRPNVNFIKYKYDSSLMRLGIELPLLLKKHKFDFAHFQYVVPPVKVCKYIVTTHDVIFRDFPEEFSLAYRLSKHWLFKVSAKMADILTTVSYFSKNSINKFLNIPLEKINVVPNAVGDDFFSSYNKEDCQKYIKETFGIENYILVVSRIEPRKNHAAVVEAFKKLDLFKRGYSLVFIGRESIIDERLNEKLSALAPEEKNHFYKFEGLNEESLIKFYKGSVLSIYPSKAEGFGIPPLESAALLVPTLCSSASAMADFTFFEQNLFDPNNEQELTYKLNHILNSDTPLEQINSIYSHIKTVYKWSASAEKLYNLIKNH